MSALSKFTADILRGLGLTKAFRREYERLPCQIQAKLYFTERGFTLPGLVDEISRGGARFHPAQSHILNRGGDSVKVIICDKEFSATIANTTSGGYGLRLHTLLTAEQMHALCATSAA